MSSRTSSKGDSWRVPGKSDDAPRFGGFYVEKLRLKTQNGKKPETTFFDHLLMHRMVTVEIPLSGRKNQKSFEKVTRDNAGCICELVSCKIYDDEFAYTKSKLSRLVYARTKGPDLEPFSIQDQLLRIGNFTTLNPHKIAARLELFQSPSSLDIVFLEKSDVKDIPDKGYVGGGFISEKMLSEVLVKAGMSQKHADRVVAIQVRLFIPSMGIYKGMLCRRRYTNGAPIELPCSMKKVLKSLHSDALN